MSAITSQPARHESLASETGRIRILFWPGTILAVMVGMGLIYSLWIGLTQRSITGDDGISILAAQGILEHGYQRLPSGFIYYRGFVPNYLVAGAIWAFGLNNFAIMLPSLLMASGSLILAYLFSRDILGRPLLGLASVAFLIALDAQILYATSPRMYMALQFFAVLAAYSAWRGYIGGEVKFQWIAIFALAGAFLSQEQGSILLVAVPAAIIAIRWFQGANRVPINYPLAIVSLLFLWIFAGFLQFYPLPDPLPGIAAHSGAQRDVVGINTDIVNWVKHIRSLEGTIPFGAMLAPVLAILLYRAAIERHSHQSQGLLYAAIILVLSGLGIATVIKTSGSRFWLFIAPIYVPLLWSCVFDVVDQIKKAPTGDFIPFWRRPYVIISGLVAWALVVFFVAHFAYFRFSYVELVVEALGWPCRSETTECSKTVKNQYASSSSLVNESDMIIASNPWVTSYYLGRVDAYYRERLDNKTFTTFKAPTDEYFGIPFVDSQQKLLELSSSQRRVWVFSDFKSGLFVSEAARNLVHENFQIYDQGTVMTVYVNHLPDSRARTPDRLLKNPSDD